jgi:hypothetical protein
VSVALPMLAKISVVAALAAAPVQVSLAAPGHAPKINTHWNYVVRATSGGKPVAAKLTAQIVDPIGGTHPVEFGANTKKIVNWPFRGVFRDYIIWPASSRGIPLRLRLVVRVGTTSKVIVYPVTPHA